MTRIKGELTTLKSDKVSSLNQMVLGGVIHQIYMLVNFSLILPLVIYFPTLHT